MNKEKATRVLIGIAWAALVISIIGWPLSALTVAKDEPQFILGLSWIAIILEAVIFLVQAYIKKDQNEA